MGTLTGHFKPSPLSRLERSPRLLLRVQQPHRRGKGPRLRHASLCVCMCMCVCVCVHVANAAWRGDQWGTRHMLGFTRMVKPWWRTCSLFQQSAIHARESLYCSIGVTLMTVHGPLAQYIAIQCPGWPAGSLVSSKQFRLVCVGECPARLASLGPAGRGLLLVALSQPRATSGSRLCCLR